MIDIESFESVGEIISTIEAKIESHQKNQRARWWFRGHSRTGWSLTPGLLRNKTQLHSSHARFNQERLMTQDFRVLSAGIRRGPENNADIYFLQQHYGMPTRLLDWTDNLLAGIFFALSNDNQDGELFAMDANRLAESQKKSPDFQGIATSRHPKFIEALKVIFDWNNDRAMPDFIFPIRPDHFDPRIRQQRSCFTFHGNNCNNLEKKDNDTLFSIYIAAKGKEKIRKELLRIGIDEYAIFGDLEHLASKIKREHGFT